MREYKQRIADKMLQKKLEGTGAVLIEGPKWCGKTTTAEQQASSIVYMDDITFVRRHRISHMSWRLAESCNAKERHRTWQGVRLL